MPLSPSSLAHKARTYLITSTERRMTTTSAAASPFWTWSFLSTSIVERDGMVHVHNAWLLLLWSSSDARVWVGGWVCRDGNAASTEVVGESERGGEEAATRRRCLPSQRGRAVGACRSIWGGEGRKGFSQSGVWCDGSMHSSAHVSWDSGQGGSKEEQASRRRRSEASSKR